jgi:hypothetical protein
MDIKEFRIGNLIFDRGNKVLKIDSIQWIGEGYHKIEMQQYIGKMLVHPLTEYNDYLKPIPLTDEWLSNLGFEYEPSDSGNDFWQNTKGLTIYKSIIEGYFCDILFDYTEINYVHELQNLHFALTKTELVVSSGATNQK